ncbi:pentatricopeptide repeat-containing protein At2g22070 [Cryptomeria japonica]|uniref:pentatricopeptide repeat-containing protein At2g22070 n=1 Tax=Cryptomeria japonica TaxID=3369 RepID=UPI0027DA6DEF|nr:pentatricopeptide repeat-containing protein At2g22070 [Cryptomeria japonica]
MSFQRVSNSHIKEGGFMFVTDKLLQNTLIRMYEKCGSLVDAHEVFDQMTECDVFSWNAIIAVYRRHGYPHEALTLFHKMRADGIQPNQFTFASILSACSKVRVLEHVVQPNSATFASILPAYAKMGALEQGMEIHQNIVKRGFLSAVVIANALVDMYAKCGSTREAHKLFDKMPQRDVVSWSAIITGYAQNRFAEKALESFKQMQLAGCAQNGFLDEASRLFREMPQRNVVSWNAMIAGYSQNDFVEKALLTFKEMQLVGLQPNATTFASILPACAKTGALEQGYEQNGFVERALEIFKQMRVAGVNPDSTTFVSILPACAKMGALEQRYAQNGLCKDALELFELTKQSGTCPDCVSFVCVLLACSHAGLVNEGCEYFNGMTNLHNIMPTIDHYGHGTVFWCMVDLFGRAGYHEETLNFIIKMPITPVVVVWTCFLGSCKAHKNIKLGLYTATLLFELDAKNAAT